MVPHTAAAIVAFVLLVIPGVVFELLRQTRRPGFEQTGLEEAARILVASIMLGAAAVSLLAAASVAVDGLVIDISTIAHRGTAWYWRNHPSVVLASIGLEVTLATLIGLVVHRSLNNPPGMGVANRVVAWGEKILRHGPTQQIVRFPVWWTVLCGSKPPDSDTKVTILKKDGTMITGVVAAFSSSGSKEDRDIALQQPIEVLRPGGTVERVPPGWKLMVVSAIEISEILVTWAPVAERPSAAAIVQVQMGSDANATALVDHDG